MANPSDEYCHTPGPETNWQENYAFYGWDPANACGFYLHLQHIPFDGIVDVRVAAGVDGELTSTTGHAPGTSAFDSPGLSVEIEKPFERIRLRYEGNGNFGPDAEGWIAQPGGNTPFGFDIILTSRHEPVDWALVSELGLDPLLVGSHYEGGAVWSGKVWANGRIVDGSGLMVRDHSWGARNFKIDAALWTPMVFGEAETFVSACCVLQDRKWRTFSIEANSNGVVNIAHDHWIRPNGPMLPRMYDKATSLRNGDGFVDRYELEGHVYLPVLRHKSFESGAKGWCDMFSTVRGKGREGFSTFQWGPVDVEQLRRVRNAAA